MDKEKALGIFEIYSDTIQLTKKLKVFIKLENLLEESKNDKPINFFSFNEEINQKIEIFVLEIKNKTIKSSPISPEIKVNLKKTSLSTNKASKDFTATSNKLSKDYTPNSQIIDYRDNSEFSFTNTGKNSKTSLTFDEKAKMFQTGNFPMYYDKHHASNNPLSFIKKDNFFSSIQKSAEEHPFFLLEQKKQETSGEFVLPRKSFGEG